MSRTTDVEGVVSILPMGSLSSIITDKRDDQWGGARS